LIRRLPAAAATSGAGEEDHADQSRLVREEDIHNWSGQEGNRARSLLTTPSGKSGARIKVVDTTNTIASSTTSVDEGFRCWHIVWR
jgi:hypothetical protein